jgi:hypothetical protein
MAARGRGPFARSLFGFQIRGTLADPGSGEGVSRFKNHCECGRSDQRQAPSIDIF